MQTQNFAKNSNVKMIKHHRVTSELSEVVEEIEFMEQQTENAYLEANQSQKVQNWALNMFTSLKENEVRSGPLSVVLSQQKVEHNNVLPLEASELKGILDQTAAPEILPTRNPQLILHNLRKVEEEPVAYPSTIPNLYFQDFKTQLRGGFPQEDKEERLDVNQPELLAKFQQYKQKILNDTNLERDLKLFIEVLASRIPTKPDHGWANIENISDENQLSELSFDIRRHLLSFEGSENSKILLLTGQAGSGKSLFCKHLQRTILADWSQKPETEDRNWFSLYIELSNLKNPKSEAISEILTRELSLTDNEIRFLKDSKQSNLDLPRILFIFDGYDSTEGISALHSLSSRQHFPDNNFSMLNKIDNASWKDARFIITCREETLQKIQRRDILFAPLANSELSSSFLQRKIEPFSDEQITCYLKKYHHYGSQDIIEEGSSWNRVKVFEKMMDNYQLREIARMPFMLWIICQMFPKLVTNQHGHINEDKSIHPQRLSRRFLIDSFLNEVIRSITKESLVNKEEHKDAQKEEKDVDLHLKEIRQQAQDLALKLQGYSLSQLSQAATDCNMNDNTLVMNLNPLVKWDNNHFQAKFGYLFLQELLVAKSIEEEISEMVPSKQDEGFKIKKELLINQRLLTSQGSDATVIFFLIDAIKDQRLTANQFTNLIYLSRKKQLDQENDDESTKDEHPNPHSQFTVAAANAITILNAAGHDFSHQDFSFVRIPSANLSNGNFEATSFASAYLQGVDFTGAWLKDANFVQANLESVEFGEIRSLKLRDKKPKTSR